LATFVILTRNLELLVARAVGVTAWGFLVPPLAIAAAAGIGSVVLFNPVSAVMNHSSTATVARLDPSGEFGFLETAAGRKTYFPRNSVLNGGLAPLAVGSLVTFASELGQKGAQASTVRLLGKHALR